MPPSPAEGAVALERWVLAFHGVQVAVIWLVRRRLTLRAQNVLITFSNVNVHVVLATLAGGALPLLANEDLLHDVVPGRGKSLEGPVLLKIALEIWWDHILQGVPFRQIRNLLALKLCNFLGVGVPLGQHRVAQPVVGDHLRLVDAISQPLKAHAALARNFSGELVPGTKPTTMKIFTKILDRLECITFAEHGQDGVDLFVEIVHVHSVSEAVGGLRLVFCLHNFQSGFGLKILDPFEGLLGPLVGLHELLEFKLEVGESLLVATEERYLSQRLVVNQALLIAAVAGNLRLKCCHLPL